MGHRPSMLVAGAGVQVGVSGVYLAYAFLGIDEPRATGWFAAVAGVFALLAAAGAHLAVRR